jgi:hypothetical protein
VDRAVAPGKPRSPRANARTERVRRVRHRGALKNRLNAEQIAVVLPIMVEQYRFYAPMQLVPTKPAAGPKGRAAVGTGVVGTGDRDSDRERAAAAVP